MYALAWGELGVSIGQAYVFGLLMGMFHLDKLHELRYDELLWIINSSHLRCHGVDYAIYECQRWQLDAEPYI